jgi:hypothetical protein
MEDFYAAITRMDVVESHSHAVDWLSARAR